MFPVLAAIDVGRVANVGWWHHQGRQGVGGHDLDELCGLLSSDLAKGEQVALGFEAPLWVPLAKTVADLGKQRPGEGNRSWGASAGAAVLACGLQQSTYVLTEIARASPRATATIDAVGWHDGDAQLLIWEAFVSGLAKDPHAEDPHVADAQAAVMELERRLTTGELRSDLEGDRAISIAGLAIHLAGLGHDASLLSTPTLVIKAPVLAR